MGYLATDSWDPYLRNGVNPRLVPVRPEPLPAPLSSVPLLAFRPCDPRPDPFDPDPFQLLANAPVARLLALPTLP